MNPLYLMLGGIVTLFLLLHERARFVAALIVFVVIVIAAAQVMGLPLTF